MEFHIENIGEYLKAHEIKPSYQRIKIFQYLVENKNHPTVDMIYKALCTEIPTLSKTTVYNTLNLFIEKKIVNVIVIEENETRYDSVMAVHGHFKCEKCGKIYDIGINQNILEDAEYLKNKMYQEAIESLSLVQNSISMSDIDRICAMIYEAKKVHMLGYQFNKIISNDFQMKMLKHRKFIYAFVERGDEIQRLDMIDESSLVIIITVRAREQLMNALINKVKEHHPKILLLTMNQNYQNEDIDWIYRIDGTESQYSESSLQGTMNFLSLLNLIYVRYGLLYRE